MNPVASLVVLVVIGLTDLPLDSLIRQLGSSVYRERESATLRIEEIGEQSLPALKSARESKDPEIRTRVAILADRIEAAQLTRPTMITLDYQNQSVKAAIEAINKRNHARLVLLPEDLPAWDSRLITKPSPAETLPYWSALDRLCEDAGIHVNPAVMNANGRRDPTLGISDGMEEPSLFCSDHGPFRVTLMGVNYTQNLSFHESRRQARLPDQPVQREIAKNRPMVNEQFNVALQLVAEPRLMIQQTGTAVVIEAFDDLGESLEPRKSDQNIQRFSGYMGFQPVPTVQLQVDLRRPKSIGKMIRKLKGTVPMVISTRRPDPLRIALTDPADKIHKNEEVAITVAEVKPKAESPQRSFEIKIRNLAQIQTGGVDAEINAGRSDLTQQQRIEIVDATGQPLIWYPSNIRAEEDAFRISIVLPSNGQGPPTEVRYYGILRTSTDVPFQFENIPLDDDLQGLINP